MMSQLSMVSYVRLFSCMHIRQFAPFFPSICTTFDHDTTAALLITMCSPVLALKTEPATVHSEFLLWPRSLVWLEEYLFTERGNLLTE